MHRREVPLVVPRPQRNTLAHIGMSQFLMRAIGNMNNIEENGNDRASNGPNAQSEIASRVVNTNSGSVRTTVTTNSENAVTTNVSERGVNSIKDSKVEVEHNFVSHFTGHKNSYDAKTICFFGLNSEYIVSASDGGNIVIWNVKTTEMVCVLKGTEKIRAIIVRPKIISFASCNKNQIKIWTPSAEQPVDKSEIDKLIEKNKEENGTIGSMIINVFQVEPIRREPERGEPERGEPERWEPERGEPERGEPERGEHERGEHERREPTQAETEQRESNDECSIQ
jgi:hypothetical protein